MADRVIVMSRAAESPLPRCFDTRRAVFRPPIPDDEVEEVAAHLEGGARAGEDVEAGHRGQVARHQVELYPPGQIHLGAQPGLVEHLLVEQHALDLGARLVGDGAHQLDVGRPEAAGPVGQAHAGHHSAAHPDRHRQEALDGRGDGQVRRLVGQHHLVLGRVGVPVDPPAHILAEEALGRLDEDRLLAGARHEHREPRL